ncbi:hypothetical protein ABZX38_33215 [Streptomyces longwoodensis]|uniref:hypothetical protein n=1 Tax=Streptomyces longwoodensis TaxID=68231 RepID=UPI0033A6DD54
MTAKLDRQGLELLDLGVRLAGGGLVVRDISDFETLQVCARDHPGGVLPPLRADRFPARRAEDAAATLANSSLAYLTYRKVKDASESADHTTELSIHASGPAAEEVA